MQLGIGRLAHRAHAACILGDDLVERPRLVAALESVVADNHLEVLVAAAGPPLGGSRELVAVIGAETERRIDRDFFARAAEQPPDRLPERLALEVPQRDVDRGDRVARVAGLPARAEQPVEPLPDALMGQRIFADQDVRGDFVDRGGDDLLFRDAGDAVADATVVGMHLRKADGERGGLLYARGVQHHGNVERRRDDSGDLHSVFMPASFTTAAQRFVSSAICAPSSAEVLGAGVAPCFARFSRTSGALSAARSTPESFWITALGVPGGATRNTLRPPLKPPTVSPIPGHSGLAGMRCRLVTASGRMRPAFVGPAAASALMTAIGT